MHLFWSSHEEKQPWLELSMGGGHGGSSERKGGRGGGGHSCLGVLDGRAGYWREARWLLLCPCCSCPLAIREKKAGRRKVKRREIKEKKKGRKQQKKKGKFSKPGNFQKEKEKIIYEVCQKLFL
jgi:hypothetical protein